MKVLKKIDPRNILLIFVSTGVTLLVLEILLRILLAGNQTYLLDFYQDRSFRTPNQYWKNWHYTNASTRQKADCFDAIYTSNEYGMRATTFRDSADFTIALLGDSFVEGYGEPDDSIFPTLLDSLTGKKVEILNFGMSGGFGTIHEVAQYENFARHFKPDLVILCYLNYNDVHDNIKAIREGLISKELEFTYPKGTFEDVLKEINRKDQPPPLPAIVKYSYVLKMAHRGKRAFHSFMQTATNTRLNFNIYLANTYNPEAVRQLQKGYDIASVSLSKLAKMTKADSAELLVINLPDPYQVDKNWIARTEKEYSVKLDPTFPNQVIQNICDGLDIRYYDMYPNAVRYIDENQIKFPYFSHDCDNHPNPAGHRYLAENIYNYLVQNDYLNF